VFGIGGSELIVILIVALIFLGPDKLPDAAKQISKGIRDLKKQSRILQEQIENDEHIGGALRDIKSALRGDELPVRRPGAKPVKRELPEATVENEPASQVPAEKPAVTLPPTAGEGDGAPAEPAEVAELVKPVEGTVAKTTPPPIPPAKQKHG
jgi:Tat protein translocase TatB subunit